MIQYAKAARLFASRKCQEANPLRKLLNSNSNGYRDGEKVTPKHSDLALGPVPYDSLSPMILALGPVPYDSI